MSNVDLIQAEAESTALPDGSCDLVFLANVWHEFADRSAVLNESRRILKHRGRIAILDWRPDVERENGPPLDHRLDAFGCRESVALNRIPSSSKRECGPVFLARSRGETGMTTRKGGRTTN